MLRDKGIAQPHEVLQTQDSGAIAEIRSAVLNGNAYYFLRLEEREIFYSISAAENRDVVTLNVGDRVTINHALSIEGQTSSILDCYSLRIDGRAS